MRHCKVILLYFIISCRVFVYNDYATYLIRLSINQDSRRVCFTILIRRSQHGIIADRVAKCVVSRQ